MKEKASSRETNPKENPIAEMSDQAFKNWEKVLRSSIKLQEQAGEWWTNSLNSASLAEDWRKRFAQMSSLASGILPETQKQMEEAVDLLGQSSKTGNELFKKALDAAQSPVLSESQAKWIEFWSASMHAVRSNTEAVMQMNKRAVDTWIQFVQKNGEMDKVRAKAA